MDYAEMDLTNGCAGLIHPQSQEYTGCISPQYNHNGYAGRIYQSPVAHSGNFNFVEFLENFANASTKEYCMLDPQRGMKRKRVSQY
jgi:hypothetical protein